jgi:hypothetical protein
MWGDTGNLSDTTQLDGVGILLLIMLMSGDDLIVFWVIVFCNFQCYHWAIQVDTIPYHCSASKYLE